MAGRQKKKQSSSSWRPMLNPILYTIVQKQLNIAKKGQVSTAAHKIKLCQTKQVYYYNRRHNTIYHNNTVLSILLNNAWVLPKITNYSNVQFCCKYNFNSD